MPLAWRAYRTWKLVIGRQRSINHNVVTATDTSVFLTACAAIAREHDRERYLACLYAPDSRRDALFALLAANHEIAKTAEVVSEPAIGQIRLQWWREALEGVEAGRPRAHEVAIPLAEAVERGGLRPQRLYAIIEVREADLDEDPPADLDALDRYAAGTAGELHAAMAEILSADPVAASLTGTAWGLLGLMRAAPALIAIGRRPLPDTLLQECGLSHQNIRDFGGSIRLGDAVRPVVERARLHLVQAHDSVNFHAPAFRPLRLLADRASDHASLLERADFEPFDLPPAARPTGGLIWRHAVRMMRYRLGF
jgi:NADH dehydrogenase [ubiquinone] 1 alpha subcomplex assembly factor 6